VQFFNPRWSFGAPRRTSAKLIVDGKLVAVRKQQSRGSSVLFALPNGIDAITPVAESRWLRFVTERGKKIGYTLRRASEAVALTKRCIQGVATNEGPIAARPDRERQSAQAPTQDAPRGAFGEPIAKAAPEAAPPRAPVAEADPAPSSKPVKLSRQETLPAALEYLASSGGSFEIAAPKAGRYKYFPVNWSLPSGVHGGMMIMTNTAQAPDDAMSSLINDIKSACKGTFKSSDVASAPSDAGPLLRATATCRTTKTIEAVTFTVRAEAERSLTIIMETAKHVVALAPSAIKPASLGA